MYRLDLVPSLARRRTRFLPYPNPRSVVRRWPRWGVGLAVIGLSVSRSVIAFEDRGPVGVLDEVVVTAGRVETRRIETPQRVEVITREDIERTPAVDLTDVLKKTVGVDVIQYPGVLSGIGIRGFRPEFDGINKRSLLLIDGRPAGSTNLGTILLDNVERIEVLRGPASALYGSSAMGGVVNVITRKSRESVSGEIRAGYGSFETYDLGARAGGSLTESVDFDLTASYYNQSDDFRMGSGDTRPNTSFYTQNLTGRLGADVAERWRIDGKFDVYQGRDIATPGDIFDGTTNQQSKDIDRLTSDIRLGGRFERHAVSFTLFAAREENEYTRLTSRNPADQPYVPFRSFSNQIDWFGAQAQNDWQWSDAHNLVVGIDYEKVEYAARSYRNTGERIAPFTPNNQKDTLGVYAENTFRFNEADTVLTLGGRFDYIDTETLETPFKTDFTPSSASFSVFNPSIGFKQLLWPNWRLHGTAGRAFKAPDAGELTGYNESVVGGQVRITQGNPNLDPERSTSWDVGLEYVDERIRFDLTYFQTRVTDRIARVVLANPPPPDPVIASYVNADSADIKGLELEGSWRIAHPWSLFANANYYFERTEEVGGQSRNILNVPRITVRAGVDYEEGPWIGRFSLRYVGKQNDFDWNVAGTPIIEYPTFTVADLHGSYRFAEAHRVSLDVKNLFDKDYFEKKGFPLAGRSFLLRYHYEF